MSGSRRVRLAAAAAIAMAAAVPVTASVIRFTGWERSTWIRIVLAPGETVAPPLKVAYSADPEAALPIIWEAAAANTLLGLRASTPVTLLAVDTDRGAVPPWLAQTWAPGWERVAQPPGLRLRGAGVIDARGAFQRFSLTFEPSTAIVDVGWLDQLERVDLSASRGTPHTVTLTRPTARLGWVLLPPKPIDRIALRRDGHAAAFSLQEITVRGTPQVWPSRSPAASEARGAASCLVTHTGDAVRVEGSAEPCDLPLHGLGPFNRVPLVARFAIWVLFTLVGFAALWAIAPVASRAPRVAAPENGDGHPYRTVFRTIPRLRWRKSGQPPFERTASWTLVRLAAVVTMGAAAYHLAYILAVPPHFNFDSLGYYAFGRNLLHTGTLDAVGTCRTPGYPAAIALSIFLFGDRIQPLIAAQHLSLAALGTLVVWFLYPRVGPVWAAIGGLFAGVAPIMTLLANIVWTETFFVVFATAALLIFVSSPALRPPAMAAAGVLTGVATLIRPNGAVLAPLLIGWIFLQWWCASAPAPRVRRLLVPAGIVAASFMLVIAPWVIHFHRVTGHWGLSDASCSQEGQTLAPVRSGLQPTNIFQLAGFVNLISQNDHVSALAIAEPHRVVFEFFPARHRYYAGRFLPGELTYDDRFTGELFREYLRVFPGTYLRQVRDALVFNLTHVLPQPASIFPYPDLADVIRIYRTRAAEPPGSAPSAPPAALAPARTITWPEAEVLLGRMPAWAPPQSPYRSLHLGVNETAMNLWGVVAVLGLVGGLRCLLVPGNRACALLGAHALILAAAPAVLAMAADRYAMVAEPALYVLIALLFGFPLRRRSEPAQ